MTLIEAFNGLADPRRAEGRRSSLGQIFSMVVVSNLCGYLGYRPVAKFCKANESVMVDALGLKHGVPSHVTFRDLLQRTDSKKLIEQFNAWSAFYVPLEAGDWISGDGKALGSTIENMHDSGQDFQAVVSMFCQQRGLVRVIGEYRNAKKSEVEVLRNLLQHLKDAGAIIRTDALHTQKND